ncbi:MAG TPA: phenylalanine--tRNA ligase subunit beta [Acidobacteriota bacterium]|nr:phenylalanine--tRNA ligase subunit beta [Acidobacteriota bacterium]
MPIVNIDLEWLNRLLGKPFPPEKVSESLEQIGCDVEEVVEITRSRCPNCGSLVENPLGQEEVKTCNFCGHESEVPFERAGTSKVVRLDLLAARPDLFDVGGLARALHGTLEITTGLPDYPIRDSGLSLTVDPSTEDVRPYIQCAVMTLPEVDETSLVAIMKLQENLHWGVGRDRKLASIGVYDLETLEGDITYTTLDPDSEPFVPLGMPGRPMTGRQILEEHPKGEAYAHLLSHLPRYPVLRDEKGQVLSMPPIINSEETRIKVGTKRVFIDVTGISRSAAVKALDTLICSLAELGGEIESVRVVQDGQERTSPDLTPRQREVDLEEARRWLGLPLNPDSLMASMRRMRFDIEALAGSSAKQDNRFLVRYPAYRTDIRHMVDLLEDIAIGYGYLNIEPRLVRSMTVGEPRPEEQVGQRARQVMIGLGYSEIMSLPLTTAENHYERLRQDVPERFARVSNPKLKAYDVLRSHLLTGLLEALYENRRRPVPLRLFELDNVVALDDEGPTRTAEERRLAVVEIGPDAGYAAIRTAVDALLREMGQEGRYQAIEHPTFVTGRVASFTTDGQLQGVLGELHPEILNRFNLEYPVGLAEITLHRIF